MSQPSTTAQDTHASNNERSRLRWLCRRGVKELDILMSHYLEHDYSNATETERLAFYQLLQLEDPVLFEFIVSEKTTGNTEQDQLLAYLRRTIMEKNQKK